MTHRFLLVQLADIGDLIVTTPAIDALREAHPDAHLTLLTTAHSAPVIENTRLVDKIITFDRRQFNSSTAMLRPANMRRLFALRQDHYDTIIYFHHFTLRLGTLKFALIALVAGATRRVGLDNGNGWFLTDRLPDHGFGAKHQAQYWLDLVELVGANPSARPAQVYAPRPFYTTNGKNLNIDFGLENPPRYPQAHPLVIIHPGSGGYSLARRWDAAKFATVADALHEEYGAAIMLVGGANDNTAEVKAAMKHQPLDFTGKTSLSMLAVLLAHEADLFIGADSGVMHLAAAAGTPVVAIFGPSNPDAWSPWTAKSIVVRSAPECSPCSYVRHTVGLRDGCAARTCMRMVTPKMVIEAARELLNNPDKTWTSRTSQPAPPFDKRIRILGLPVDAITYEEWLTLIENWVNAGDDRAHHVCTINPEFIMIAQNDVNFFNILSRADLCVPDGVGLLYAARHLGTPLPQRVTGSDGVPIIAERAAEKGWRLFFLGAAPGVADQAADVLRRKHPTLQIVGKYSGCPAADEEDAIVERVNASGADLLFVAYGAPDQDKWIARNLPRLHVKMAMGVGGAFDFIAGIVPRAPLWMQRFGLEWLYRLYLQPWRIRRMMRLPMFALKVILRGKS